MNRLHHFFLILFLVLPLGFADESKPEVTLVPPPKEAPGLAQLLRNALERNGQIKESMGDVEIARGQLAQAKAAMWPKAGALVLAAPIFEERGNALHSESNWGKWGPIVQGSIQIAQPLYTFGQISSYKQAAESQINARTELADVKRSEVVYSTKEIYYGYQMATELEILVDDTVKFLEEAVETAEKSMKEETKDASVKPHDLYKLKSALEDLRQKKLYAKQARQTAERAVSWITVTAFDTIGRRPLTAELFQKNTLEEYLKQAKTTRPEFRALAAGKQARASLRDAKAAQSYPVIFVGAFGTVGWSPVRDKQDSVYANDPYNPLTGGVGLGLKFDLEFARHSAEASEQEGELMKLAATESYAAPGIELQVKKAFWELEQAIDSIEIAKRRKAVGRKWFVSSAMGWSIGLTPAKDLLESLEGDAVAKKNYIETLYSLNIALAKLTQAVGAEVTELKYR